MPVLLKKFQSDNKFVGRRKNDMTREHTDQFPKQSIWGMIGLTIITLTFYFPFWLRKHTRIVNRILPDAAIASWWFPVCITVTILNLGMVIPEILTNDHPAVMLLSKIMEKIDIILTVVWTFKLRNRMNTVLEAQPKQPEWYHGFWTLFFGIFYLQHKVNKLSAASQTVEQKDALDKK